MFENQPLNWRERVCLRVLAARQEKLSRLFYPGYQLNWVNETQGNQEPNERRRHIHDRHRVNRLTGSNARRKHRIVQGYDQCLAVGTCCQERQFKHRNRAYERKETGSENSSGGRARHPPYVRRREHWPALHLALDKPTALSEMVCFTFLGVVK